jgi:hypothetical protein
VVHRAALVQVDGAHTLLVGHRGGVVGVTVHDRAGALRRQRRQPGVLGRDDHVGRKQRERAPAAALTEQHRDGGHRHRGHRADAAGDLARDRPLL